MLRSLGTHSRVILVLRECIWNAPAVSLVLPTFDDTGSLGSLPRRVESISLVPSWVTSSRFRPGNKEAELKLTISLHSCFPVFSCFSSSLDPPTI